MLKVIEIKICDVKESDQFLLSSVLITNMYFRNDRKEINIKIMHQNKKLKMLSRKQVDQQSDRSTSMEFPLRPLK